VIKNLSVGNPQPDPKQMGVSFVYVEGMGERFGAYKILIVKPGVKRSDVSVDGGYS
jgi:hypothetical protein